MKQPALALLLLIGSLLTGCAKTYYYAAFNDDRPHPASRAGAPPDSAQSVAARDTVYHVLWWMKSKRGYQTDTSMPTAVMSTCPPWGIQPEISLFEVQRGDSLLVAKRNESLKLYMTAVPSMRGEDTVCGEVLTPAAALLRGAGALRFHYGCRYKSPDPLMAQIATVTDPVTLPVRTFKTRKTLKKACEELPRGKVDMLRDGAVIEPGGG